ncbi:MAG: tRNA (guanosine(46)-N7)-methyltransferase TrmB [Rhizobiales bacterium]|nr:tRNA (guanosine(46)-N7)-methyltransferase TrmB [Hyphomicrobiales bacterium]NRB15246.1 tRNA (guanosine(46)-N7)-methyltransferase TrmB [Hyphomicrobiales bacterium]
MNEDKYDPDNPLHKKRKVHGRTFVKGMSQRQFDLLADFLPKVALDVGALKVDGVQSLFDTQKGEYWMEVGFGGGEHLARLAREHPDVGFIGCEPFQNGVAKLLIEVEDDNIGNIAVHSDDARTVLDALPDASLDKLFLLYPDPWHKSKHHKRRFICAENMVQIARVLKPGAVFFVASDIPDYVSWTLRHLQNDENFEWLAEQDTDWLQPPKGWQATRYEAKAQRHGRKSAYLFFRRL